jgi:hypothetical protein
MMSRSVTSVFLGVAWAMLVTACAGPMMQSGPAGLPGMWHGSFTHAGADYTAPSNADLTLQVRDDSTYSFKWGTRTESTGTIVDQGNRVVLNDSSGSQTTLTRSGETLNGATRDAATGRSTVMSLAKDESAPTQSAKASERLCRAAGATFSQGVCRSVIDPAVAAHQCEERGGVYSPRSTVRSPLGAYGRAEVWGEPRRGSRTPGRRIAPERG